MKTFLTFLALAIAAQLFGQNLEGKFSRVSLGDKLYSKASTTFSLTGKVLEIKSDEPLVGKFLDVVSWRAEGSAGDVYLETQSGAFVTLVVSGDRVVEIVFESGVGAQQKPIIFNNLLKTRKRCKPNKKK